MIEQLKTHLIRELGSDLHVIAKRAMYCGRNIGVNDLREIFT